MVRSVAGNLPEQVKNNQSVNTAAGNGGQKMSQYSWFTVYVNIALSRRIFPAPSYSSQYKHYTHSHIAIYIGQNTEYDILY